MANDVTPGEMILIDDGKIDVCMIRNVKRSQIVGLAKKYEKGLHVQYTDIVERPEIF